MNYSMKTNNKSFINMWRYLQRNNVDNNLFMLQTNSKDLIDFSIEKYNSMDKEDPTFLIYKSKIIEEVKNNIWFYFRELVVVPDENSITGYKHFELTPETMAMIYLYDKHKSFINIDTKNELCLHFLWNRHQSMYNTDLVLVNDINNIELISTNIKKHIAHMECQVPLGSSQIISDSMNHFIMSNLKAFREFYIQEKNFESFIKYIMNTYNKHVRTNKWSEGPMGIFILENDMPLITYSYIIDSINKGFSIYLNSIENKMSMDSIILKNFIELKFPHVDTSIYDTDDSKLNLLYII